MPPDLLQRYSLIPTGGVVHLLCSRCPATAVASWSTLPGPAETLERAEAHEAERHSASERLERSRRAATVGEAIIALIPGAAGVVRP